MKSLARIAVYGAAGYTGRQVAEELLRRGYTPVLAGRNERALRAVAHALGGEIEVCEVQIDQPQALGKLLVGCQVLINCAGPFGVTAEPLAAAAIKAGVHYLDIAATEQRTIQTLLEGFDAPARSAGVAVVPAMGFFGTLGDMLAHLVGTALAPLDKLTVAYAIEGWVFTAGSRQTQQRLQGEHFVYKHGRVVQGSGERSFSTFSFPAPIGPLKVMEGYPLGEILTIPRHLQTQQIEALMAVATLQEINKPELPQSEAVAADLRSRSSFTIAVQAAAGSQECFGVARGVDIYGITAPIIVEAVQRLLAPGAGRVGALAPSEAFESALFLDTLQPWDFSYNISPCQDTAPVESEGRL
ncbi:NAD-dependent epimerase/dehydratase family protein [Ktedonosporobacter rubrisoli]|uniref:NAD-dependent epimerase/dehydratase family protein n=1 Tax=Ktedonosporobacter rubrisoli TaxID=2509675 RepID=A0A4P6JUY5_KTERU|nr:saccharopine dehydrogenase NADP-binding domain-containing protein [Ktedonosporobacter rubrisoli]QBD78756.1 NAD-dependent epimerase/dehydratase family protein [Ktedonosporobacter rubrisoli]